MTDIFKFALAHPGVRVSVGFDTHQQSFVVKLLSDDTVVRGSVKVVRRIVGALEWNDSTFDLGEAVLDEMAMELKYG